MAGTKISALPSATTLAGTEVVPVVQGGASKKATITQLLAGVDLSSYALTASPTFTGSVTIPTPSAGSNTTIAASTAWTRTYVTGLGYTSNAGTVESVGLSLPALFSVSGSPVTTTGTLTATLATQSANVVLAGPTTGAAAAPTFRALVAADLPATAVTAGSYTYGSFTVDAAGRLTAASNGAAPVTSVTGTAPINSSGGATPVISISIGTTTGTVAAGDDSRITGALSTATAATTYQPLDADLTAIAALSTASAGRSLLTLTAVPSGALVGTSDTQTLTAKTLGSLQESLFTITDAAGFEINPANGPIQTVTLGANRTPAATSFASGQSVKLKIDDGTAFAVTWTTVGVIWISQTAGASGTAPTLGTTGWTHIELWKEGSIIYGALIGYSAT